MTLPQLPFLALVVAAAAVLVGVRAPATTRGRVAGAVAVGAAAGLAAAALGSGVVELLRAADTVVWVTPLVLGSMLAGATMVGSRGLRRVPPEAAPRVDPATNGHHKSSPTPAPGPPPVGRGWGLTATVLAAVPVPFWLGQTNTFGPDVARGTVVAIAVMPVVAALVAALAPARRRRVAVYLASFLMLPFAVGFVFFYGPPFLVLLIAAVIQYRRGAAPLEAERDGQRRREHRR